MIHVHWTPFFLKIFYFYGFNRWLVNIILDHKHHLIMRLERECYITVIIQYFYGTNLCSRRTPLIKRAVRPRSRFIGQVRRPCHSSTAEGSTSSIFGFKNGGGRRGSAFPDEKERLERHIQATDRQIDTLVYELYGLTAEEIRIVERELPAAVEMPKDLRSVTKSCHPQIALQVSA